MSWVRCSVEQKIAIDSTVEGNSMRAVQRMTGAAQNTVAKLLVDLGRACAKYQDEHLRDLTCTRIQCDEIWTCCHAKEANLPDELKGEWGYGDVWTWVAICADTKLVPCWLVSSRDAGAAYHFMHDLKGRLVNRVQLTTDSHKAYLTTLFLTGGSR